MRNQHQEAKHIGKEGDSVIVPPRSATREMLRAQRDDSKHNLPTSR